MRFGDIVSLRELNVASGNSLGGLREGKGTRLGWEGGGARFGRRGARIRAFLETNSSSGPCPLSLLLSLSSEPGSKSSSRKSCSSGESGLTGRFNSWSWSRAATPVDRLD